ncbi:hypothetical protein ACFWZ3_00285 [Frateuria sp. GZRR35]|uniref:hypothetical protein n=1 Tax=Frateuria sp. GZRR35 TaxID=3351536 RepID=UPI003EDBC5F5
MDGSDIDDVKQLLVKLAVIAEQLDTRSRGALQRIDASATTLDRSAQRWTEGGDDFSRRMLEALGTQARDSIAGATRQALAPLDAQLRQSAEAAKWAAEALAEQRKLLSRMQQSLLRRSLLALLAGSVLAVGASGYLAWRNLRSAVLGDDVLQAVHSGALVHCPDSQALCVRIDAHPRRSGPRGEYLVVQP